MRISVRKALLVLMTIITEFCSCHKIVSLPVEEASMCLRSAVSSLCPFSRHGTFGGSSHTDPTVQIFRSGFLKRDSLS